MTTPINNHTKGPWEYVSYNWKDTDDYGNPVWKGCINTPHKLTKGRNGNHVLSTSAFGIFGKTAAEAAANARLIAAAPEFYDAAWLIDVLSESDGQPCDGFRFRKAVQMLRAALKKANGEA